jgi:hypothetical protein
MRSFLIILATVVAIGAGFFVYLWTQGGGASAGPAVHRNVRPASRPSETPVAQQMIGAGTKPWIKAFDERTGEISQEFRGDKYDTPVNGTVKVTAPEARFYLGRSGPRQLLVVRGKTGRVVVPDSSNRNPQNIRPSSEMPTSGELQDVTIELYDRTTDPTPNLVCTMNNASFDNDTLRIYTESFEENGKLIPGDQVPVQVHGVDYEFEGKGLDIHWNDRDRRLQSLVISHGKQLIVKHPSALQRMTTASTQPVSTVSGRAVGIAVRFEGDAPSVGEALQERVKRSLATTEPAGERDQPVLLPVKIVRDRATPIYRASFYDNVRVLQSEEQIAKADVMHVDFAMEQKSDATTKPATAPTTAPAKARATRRPGRRPPARTTPLRNPTPPLKVDPVSPPQTPAQHATSGPATTRPENEQPITILWTGPLRVTPADSQVIDPPTPQKPNITLIGQPVVLTQKGGRIDCASMLYRSGDGALILKNSGNIPEVTMRDAGGAVLYTPLIEYGGTGQPAVLHGASRAELPRKSDDPNAPDILTRMQWSRTCRLYFIGENADQMAIDRAEFDGDVQINDPQLRGRSDSLAAAFAPAERSAATTRPSQDLRTITASGHVAYTMISADGRKQDIECSRLNLATEKGPDKKIFVRSVEAEGPVHAFDDQQELRCGQLAMKLLPTTQPSKDPSADVSAMVVEHLLAQDTVIVSSNDGSLAKADQLTMETKAKVRTITLIGRPARVEQSQHSEQQTILSGPSITFLPDSDHASVNGGGTLHAVQAPHEGKKPQPIDMSWTGGLSADGKTNLVEISNDVLVTTHSEDGALDSAKGDRMRVELMSDPKATTQPASQPSTKPSALARAGLGGAGTSDFFKDKIVKSVTLVDNAEVSSVLQDKRGLRRMHLFAPLITFGVQDKSMDVPSAGRLLLEDNRARFGEAATAPATNSAVGGDMRGATGFRWQKQLHYDDAQRQAKMIGSVKIVHEALNDPKGERGFEANADEVDAELEPPPATKAGDDSKTDSEKLKHVAAIGHVVYTSRQMHFEAARVDYDPNSHWLVARGDERTRAIMYDDQGSATGTFDELTYNLQTGEHKVTGFRATIRK